MRVFLILRVMLVEVLAPQYLSYIHKAKVAADQANLKNYFTEIQLDYITTAKMQAGYFSVTEDTRGKGGYNIYYYCDECLSDNASVKNKHLDTCATTFL